MNNKAVEQYVCEHTTEDSEIVKELIRVSEQELEYTDMLSGRLVGQLLAMLIAISGAKRVLEIGTFTGYSALKMAEALPDGSRLFTCEYNQRYKAIARSFFESKEFSQKITLVMGKALETIPAIEGFFDFIFLDADKINYLNYYQLVMPRLRPGGLMVIDNTLWEGEVVDPQDDKAKAIHDLNNFISDDNSVEQVMLAIRDGVTVLRKIEKA